MNILHSSQATQTQEVILSVDAEKALDVVEGGYLHMVLKKIGFDQKLLNWIRILYKSPKAAVRTNKPFI